MDIPLPGRSRTGPACALLTGAATQLRKTEMTEQQHQPNVPPLSAIVYRFGKGCKQYAFENADELAAWAARHPYKNEQLRVMPVKDCKFLGDRWMPAAEAAEFVRTAQGQKAK